MISRRLPITRFQFLATYQKAFNELCSLNRQQEITTRSRTVMASQLRRYRSAVMFFIRIKYRFFTECILMADGSARRFPGRTLRT
jgi:hypothetical protein